MHKSAATTLSRRLIEVPGMVEPERALLADIVSCIVERCDPIQIILFGSRARGQARPSSDVDLLVVLPPGEQLREQWGMLLDAVARFPIEVDVLITTQEELNWRGQVPGFVHYAAIHQGKALYEQL